MARYTGPVCRLCRREGAKLFLKGDKCFSAKCAMSYPDNISAGKKEVKKPRTPPGQHGQARQRKMSEYGAQLREKQKVRRAYGLMEGQFKRTFVRASAMKGITGENLLQLLELRLDNVIYRSGIASSRAQARQFVLHGHVTVNGQKVDVPSYSVKADDVVAIAQKSKDIERFKIVREGVARVVPKWLTVNADALTINVTALPARDDIDLSLQENMIVEFYSR